MRLNIFPDGGVSRFRVFGTPDREARRAAILRELNAMDDPEARARLADFCGAPSWIEAMRAARPFASPQALLDAGEAAFARVDRGGWLEAFRHHPRIGERSAERTQSSAASESSAREQSDVEAAAAAERDALAQANRD